MENFKLGEETQKVPKNLSVFEREKLRYLLKQSNLSDLFENTKLSVSWIFFLITLKLKESYQFLARELVSRFNKPGELVELFDSLNELEESKGFDLLDVFNEEFIHELNIILNYQYPKSELLYKCWLLIIHYINDNATALDKDRWEKILELIGSNNENSTSLDELVNYLRPRLMIERPNFGMGDEIQNIEEFFNIDFRNHWYVLTDKFVDRWVNNADKANTYKLLYKLTRSLEKSLRIAEIAGDEFKNKDSKINSQVRSVAKHKLNTNRRGFYTIVRATADIWKYLAELDPDNACSFVNRWMTSKFQLVRRLALFASAEPVVSEDIVCELLLSLDDDDFFGASSSVEVYRLIDARWKNFTLEQKGIIENRIVSPLKNEFKSKGEEVLMRNFIFNLIGHLERIEPPLSNLLKDSLSRIKEIHPEWEFFPKEYAGFHFRNYSENIEPEPIDIEDEESVDRFINGVLEFEAFEHEIQENNWRDICVMYPSKALTALIRIDRPKSDLVRLWSIFFLNVPISEKTDNIAQILDLISDDSNSIFDDLHLEISQWLATSIWHEIEVEKKIWKLFDRIAKVDSTSIFDASVKGYYVEKHSTVYLAEILIRLILRSSPSDALDPNILKNLRFLLKRTGMIGRATRKKFAQFLPTLFNRFPELVSKEFIPLFDWNADRENAKEFWLTQVGNEGLYTRELFKLLKRDFVEIFRYSHKEIDLFEFFAKQLVSMAVSNQLCNIDYEIGFSEIRKLLRDSKRNRLPIFANELINVLKEVEIGERLSHWTNVVGPVYKGIWPLDEKLRTPRTSELLVELIVESEGAIKDAYSTVSRFIKKGNTQSIMGICKLAELKDDIVNSAPKDVLDLLDCMIGEKPTMQNRELNKFLYPKLNKILAQIKVGDSSLEDSMIYKRISQLVGRMFHE